jgi:putative NADH-flavin reductase
MLPHRPLCTSKTERSIPMNIALIGATGMIGQRILKEALDRGHQVTAIVRDPSRLPLQHENLKYVTGDIFDADSIAAAAAGHDAVISAYGPGLENANLIVEAAQSLIEGVKSSGVRRLLVVGGAGSLEVAPGVQLVDTPEFPEAYKEVALAHRDALAVYRNADLDWTYFSPAALIAPGERTGTYRTGTNQLVANEQGESRISAEDYAVAMIDELENPQYIRKRFTVAY